MWGARTLGRSNRNSAYPPLQTNQRTLQEGKRLVPLAWFTKENFPALNYLSCLITVIHTWQIQVDKEVRSKVFDWAKWADGRHTDKKKQVPTFMQIMTLNLCSRLACVSKLVFSLAGISGENIVLCVLHVFLPYSAKSTNVKWPTNYFPFRWF